MTQRFCARSLVAIFGIVLLLSACDGSITFGDGIRGSGELVTAQFDVDDFDSIDVSNAFDATIAVGEQPFVEVLANENLIDELDVRIRNGTLMVGLRDGISLHSGRLEATIRVPELVALDVSGASEVKVTGSSGSTQRFDVSGASDLEVIGMRGSVTIDVSGSSDVEMQGTATDVVVESSGASDLRFDLVGVERATVDLSGASSVEFAEVDVVTGDLSGASDLTVPASADVRVSISGSSDVSRN